MAVSSWISFGSATISATALSLLDPQSSNAQVKGRADMVLPLSGTNLVVSAIFLGLLGLVECFFGYRFFRIILAVAGFFIGAELAMALVNTDQILVTILVGVVGGLIGGILFYYLYFVGTFLAGLWLGATVGGLLIQNFTLTGNAATIAVIVCAVIGGVLGILLAKYIIMISTAFTGAAQIVYAVLLLLPGTTFATGANQVELRLAYPQSAIVTLVIIVLAAIGFAVQYNTNRPVVVENRNVPL